MSGHAWFLGRADDGSHAWAEGTYVTPPPPAPPPVPIAASPASLTVEVGEVVAVTITQEGVPVKGVRFLPSVRDVVDVGITDDSGQALVRGLAVGTLTLTANYYDPDAGRALRALDVPTAVVPKSSPDSVWQIGLSEPFSTISIDAAPALLQVVDQHGNPLPSDPPATAWVEGRATVEVTTAFRDGRMFLQPLGPGPSTVWIEFRDPARGSVSASVDVTVLPWKTSYGGASLDFRQPGNSMYIGLLHG